MSECNSTPAAATGKPDKPAKPTPDFPLFAHATRRWAKKIDGKMVYFGPWDDPQGALRRYNAFRETGQHVKPRRAAKLRKRRRDATHTEAPAKPYPEFPLFAHATGRWAKKIRNTLHYFGPWSDPQAALEKYLSEKDALHAGRTPRTDQAGLTVKDAVNAFLAHKQSRVDSGELSPFTWNKYKQVTDLVVSAFGKTRLVADLGPDDFAKLRNRMTKSWGALRVRDFIQHIRSVFKYALDSGLMNTPMRFGPGFARPSKKTMRLERASKGTRMFEADELRRILDAAGQPLKAMILLGINCAYGNADCGTLPLAALDLDRGWVNYHRPKTGINRRCPLWPETVAALRDELERRPAPKDAVGAALVFITKYGEPWHKKFNPLTWAMRKLLTKLGINGHRNFYALRHGFETIGGEAKDQVAVDFIMGHADESTAAAYRERISDERLLAVTEHVRAWLFAKSDNHTPAVELQAPAADRVN